MLETGCLDILEQSEDFSSTTGDRICPFMVAECLKVLNYYSYASVRLWNQDVSANLGPILVQKRGLGAQSIKGPWLHQARLWSMRKAGPSLTDYCFHSYWISARFKEIQMGSLRKEEVASGIICIWRTWIRFYEKVGYCSYAWILVLGHHGFLIKFLNVFDMEIKKVI